MARRSESFVNWIRRNWKCNSANWPSRFFDCGFQLTTGQAEALTRLRGARKDLARVKTLLRERELRQANGN